jgi:hypothetical protein
LYRGGDDIAVADCREGDGLSKKEISPDPRVRW